MNPPGSSNFLDRLPDGRSDTATPMSPDDPDSRLNDAMQRADELLVSSLKRDEQRRRRRKIRIGLLVGGSAMIAAMGLVLLLESQGNAPPVGVNQQVAQVAATDADQLAKQGWDLWQAKKFDEAAEKFEQAVKANPKQSSAWNGLGWSRFNSGKSDAAEQAFKKVLELEPQHPAALNGLGQLFFCRNQFDQAEKYLKLAAITAPASWWGLAKIYLLQSKWDDATIYLQKIVDSGQASGSDLDQVKLMLDAARNQKLPDSLKKEISPADANSPVVQTVQQGWAAMNHGDTVKARTLFEQALATNPKDANALNGMGWLLPRTGKLDDAKSEFETALSNDPEAAGSMNGIALIDRQ